MDLRTALVPPPNSVTQKDWLPIPRGTSILPMHRRRMRAQQSEWSCQPPELFPHCRGWVATRRYFPTRTALPLAPQEIFTSLRLAGTLEPYRSMFRGMPQSRFQSAPSLTRRQEGSQSEVILVLSGLLLIRPTPFT